MQVYIFLIADVRLDIRWYKNAHPLFEPCLNQRILCGFLHRYWRIGIGNACVDVKSVLQYESASIVYKVFYRQYVARAPYFLGMHSMSPWLQSFFERL